MEARFVSAGAPELHATVVQGRRDTRPTAVKLGTRAQRRLYHIAHSNRPGTVLGCAAPAVTSGHRGGPACLNGFSTSISGASLPELGCQAERQQL